MTPAESKARAKLNALERSKQATRQTSPSSTSNSQVTEAPPQLYQVAQINVPEDMHGMTKLVQAELLKIAQSQSIVLSLWKKSKASNVVSLVLTVNGQSPDDEGNVTVDTGVMKVNDKSPDASGNATIDTGVMTVNGSSPDADGNIVVQTEGVSTVNGTAPDTDGNVELTNFPSAVTMDDTLTVAGEITTGGRVVDNGASYGVGSGVMVSNDATTKTAAEIMQDLRTNYGAGFYRYGCKASDITEWEADSCGFFSIGGDTSAFLHINYGNGRVVALSGSKSKIDAGTANINTLYGTANPPTAAEVEGLEEMLAARDAGIKAQIYAELLALNPGIIIPQTE
ncbi:hypothetical protein [Kluyvera sp. CHPC 1.2972]|uniref:hypothetical protein n=1 Tax=Kluyvera sp. CHPC 1.2972 TaxID=2995176 RepID=UPI002FD84554